MKINFQQSRLVQQQRARRNQACSQHISRISLLSQYLFGSTCRGNHEIATIMKGVVVVVATITDVLTQ